MANINKIRISGTSYDIQDSNAPKVVELTQAQYDALVDKDPNVFYIITDASQVDLSQYWTSAQTNTAISQATSGKTNQSDFTGHTADTSIHVTTAQTAAWDAKSNFSGDYNDLTNKLSAGTNITIVDNVISAEGGGGKTIEAGRGIAITTGATADTVSFNLPISAGTGTSGTYIAIGVNAYAQEGYNSFLSNAGGISIGSGSSANRNSIIIGNGAADDKYRGHGISIGTEAKSKYGSISIGEYSESSGTTNEEESSIAIGYRTTAKNVIKALAIGTDVITTGTTKTNINNQLKIDTSNQIYIMDKDNANEICLQDYLGGGSSYTAGTGIDITNDVISVTGMVDTTTYSTYTAATDTALSNKQTTLTAGTGISIVDNVISATGGGGGGNVNVVELTQAQYDALTTIDPDTIYVITDAQGGDLANYYTKTETNTLLSGKIDTSAITTSITSSSTDAQVPTAKAVYDIVGNIETLLSQI